MSGERFEQFRCPLGYRILPNICAECKQFNCEKNPQFLGDKVQTPSEIKPENPVETPAEIKPPEEFKCDICGKIFKVKIALAGHKRSHKNPKFEDHSRSLEEGEKTSSVKTENKSIGHKSP